MRPLAAGVGIGSVAFGAAPLLAPRWFGRLFGLPVPDPATASMVRSLGLRDAVLGMGLWSAAAHGGRFAPWLLTTRTAVAGAGAATGPAGAGVKPGGATAPRRRGRRIARTPPRPTGSSRTCPAR